MRSREEVKADAEALLKRVEETLARPRPPEDARWKSAPVEALPHSSRMTDDQMLDTVARGVALAMRDATSPLLTRIDNSKPVRANCPKPSKI